MVGCEYGAGRAYGRKQQVVGLTCYRRAPTNDERTIPSTPLALRTKRRARPNGGVVINHWTYEYTG